MSISAIQLYNELKSKLGDSEAQQLVAFVKAETSSEFVNQKLLFLLDKIGIMRSMYVVGVVQFLAIIGGVLAIMNSMLKK